METIATPAGGFTAETAGTTGAPLVLLLHGYPQSRHSWREQVPALMTRLILDHIQRAQ